MTVDLTHFPFWLIEKFMQKEKGISSVNKTFCDASWILYVRVMGLWPAIALIPFHGLWLCFNFLKGMQFVLILVKFVPVIS